MRRNFRGGGGRRPLLRGRPLVHRLDVPQGLMQANDFFAGGEYSASAQAFEQLAHDAEIRRLPRAPQLYLRAGQARILAGDTKTGMVHLKRGLMMIAATGLMFQLRRAGLRVTRELNERGLTAEADEISTLLRPHIPDFSAGETMPNSVSRPVLPTHCPACGASLRTDEIEWLNEITAECNYCGSPVRAE